MTRDEWVDDVIRHWKSGDMLQVRGKGVGLGWCDIECDDPILFKPMLQNYEYRIKPRMVRWAVELVDNQDDTIFHHIARAMKHGEAQFAHDEIEAIRNAKPLKE